MYHTARDEGHVEHAVVLGLGQHRLRCGRVVKGKWQGEVVRGIGVRSELHSNCVRVAANIKYQYRNNENYHGGSSIGVEALWCCGDVVLLCIAVLGYWCVCVLRVPTWPMQRNELDVLIGREDRLRAFDDLGYIMA